MKTIFKLIQRFIISSFILYIFDYFSIDYNCFVPINFITIVIVSYFGFFGLIGLVIFKYFIV